MSSTVAVAPRRAADIWRRLHGLVCVFKPAGCTVNHCMRVLRHRLAADLNAVEEARYAAVVDGRTAAAGDSASLEPPLVDSASLEPPLVDSASLEPPLAGLNPRLLTGPALQPVDVRVARLASLGRHMSGPLLLGVNSGARLAAALRDAGPQVRVHQVTARLGLATDTLLAAGRPTERAAYGHVTRGRLEAVLSGLQAAHQRLMFEHTGLPVNSQAAYELASRGPARPERGAPPVIYGLRCQQFAPPFVTIEVHSCNESSQYLLTLVADLGRQLRTAAVTVRSRCLRHGPFHLEHALLMKHWQLEHVQRNMRQCLVTAARGLTAPLSATLQPVQGPGGGPQEAAGSRAARHRE
ncbi:mitochondrial mRNA pseudouridine synthase Trub2-like isoform X2 [Amphibalanus amphitrite]|nr:mitochondrial mRNA pseudouridine synthase Trub2-like isoform X2 [Amphibalanus amphitrite]XP_043188335.1 mitochondrial mRNA pseudouridine synthase Trub2-like isoform X2 [Amphibalanus amphitrite]XP_043188336.1 mitochondrial mRNA pseudouridine synthase Trub2-like isoform X2 [Amphibalanus amphitrite]